MVLKQIKKAFELAKLKNYDKLYGLFDIHETILVPDYDNKQPSQFYPYAKEALQLISKHPMLVNIIYTCSHSHEIERYQKFFKENEINFHYVNENPEISDDYLGNFTTKMYASFGLDDKFGFDALTEWEEIYNYFKELVPESQEK